MTKLAIYIEFEAAHVDPHPQREEGSTNYEVLAWLQTEVIPLFKKKFNHEVGLATVCGAEAGKSDLDYLKMDDWVRQKRKAYGKVKRQRQQAAAIKLPPAPSQGQS